MEWAFWAAIVLDFAALGLLIGLARGAVKHTLAIQAASLLLGLLFIFGTAANCANGVHTPLIPSLIGLALSSAASCLALEGRGEDAGHE